MTDRDKLQKGIKYKITFNDCCVAGEFVGTFINYQNYEGNECSYSDEDFDEYVFDFGTFGYSYYPFNFEEVGNV